MHQQNPVDATSESCGTTRIRRTPTESCLHLQHETGYPMSLWRVSTALKIAYEATKARAFPVEVGTK